MKTRVTPVITRMRSLFGFGATNVSRKLKQHPRRSSRPRAHQAAGGYAGQSQASGLASNRFRLTSVPVMENSP
jgi:hypothetical protein